MKKQLLESLLFSINETKQSSWIFQFPVNTFWILKNLKNASWFIILHNQGFSSVSQNTDIEFSDNLINFIKDGTY